MKDEYRPNSITLLGAVDADFRLRALLAQSRQSLRTEVTFNVFVTSGQPVGNALTEPGAVEDALSNTLVSELDLAPTPKANRVLPAGERCTFSRSPEADPVFWIAREGATVAMKLNGILMVLEPADDAKGSSSNGRYNRRALWHYSSMRRPPPSTAW